MNLFSVNQPWWQPYAELVFWVLLGIGLMCFTAYHPSLDDVMKGIMMGAIAAVWSQVTSKITELRTRTAVKKEERDRTAGFLKETLSQRIGEPITNDTVVQVAKEVTKEDRAVDRAETATGGY